MGRKKETEKTSSWKIRKILTRNAARKTNWQLNRLKSNGVCARNLQLEKRQASKVLSIKKKGILAFSRRMTGPFIHCRVFPSLYSGYREKSSILRGKLQRFFASE